MKETSKSDLSSSSKAKNGGSTDTPRALFPRLHVKEAISNGPRAPPRNKMALYEQFTIPSHKFQQPIPPQQEQQQQQQHHNGVQSPQTFMPQAFAGGYYMPYFMPPPPMAYQPMNVLLQSQTSLNGDSECDQIDVQRVPGEKKNLCRVSSLQSKSGASSKSKTKKKGGKHEQPEDFTVPTYNLKRIASQQKQQQTWNTSGANSTVCTATETLNRPEFSNRSSHKLQNAQPAPAPQSDSSNEGIGGIESQSDEELRHPQEISDDSETSILENILLSSPELSSKEILSVIGDEKFWKMRKAMQRQQSIFQKQLFELHRVIKVQQLMAAAGLGDRRHQDHKHQQQGHKKKKSRSSTEEQARKTTSGGQKTFSEDTRARKSTPHDSRDRKKPPDPVTIVEESSPPRPESNTTSAAPAVEASYDHRCYPPANNLGYGGYPSFPPMHHHPYQWFAPVPVPFPFQQPFGAPPPAPPPPPPPMNIYSSPFGPVFPPVPFVPYPCEQRPAQESRFNVAQPQQWQHETPVNAFTDQSMEWMEQAKDLQSQVGSSSAGFNLIQRSSKETSETQEHHQQQQQQEKLVGKFSAAKQTSSAAGKSSPYSRPSGFHAVSTNTSSLNKIQQSSSKIIKVAPKAAMVTPELAAEILQSISQERPDR